MSYCGGVRDIIGEIRWTQRALNEVVIAFRGKRELKKETFLSHKIH